jgi:diguanylate cyclase (GGDEF)-like protein/PAS domain S-box-containing protein
VAAEIVGSGGDAGDEGHFDILGLPIGGPAIAPDEPFDDPERAREQIRVLRHRYRALAERLPAIIYVDDVDDISSNIYTSPQTREILGVPPVEWAANPHVWIDMLHPDDRDRVIEEHRRSNETGEDFVSEYRLIRPDGRVVWIRDHAILVQGVGDEGYWQGVMHDITELKQAQRALADTQAKYRAIVEDIPAIVYVDEVDDVMSTSYVSPQIEELLGISPEEYITDPDLWYHRLHPDDRERALEEYLRGRESGESFTFEYRLIARDGRVVWFRDSAVVIRDDMGTPIQVQGVMLDMTERKQAEEKAAFLAYHDKLTGLPNRTMFEELLELAISRARRHGASVAVVYADLDDFKLVNDSLGHEAGDELLRQLAGRLKEATRETDLVARQGGDEFLLLLADLDRSSEGIASDVGDNASIVAESVASRVQEALATPFDLGGTEVYISASVGMSLFPKDAPDAATLLKNADQAMYQSKRLGPGGYSVHAADSADAMSRLSLTTRLRKAVENQNWELHYQPLVDLANGRMFGVEALIRWPDPTGGLVPPGEFIPLAEEMGLIEAIGDWVVEELGRQDHVWRGEGIGLELSFNLSPRQLWQPDLAQKIMSRLDACDVNPGNVVVEITESTAMIDPDRTQRILTDLHDRGLRLAIDDFGTGYSSLSRLKHLPVDILKIDRTFVRGVDSDVQAGNMVCAIIGLADSLGMTPLAEGIETSEEWRFLVEHGCPLGQGFLFSRPVPAVDIGARHRRADMSVVDQTG